MVVVSDKIPVCRLPGMPRDLKLSSWSGDYSGETKNTHTRHGMMSRITGCIRMNKDICMRTGKHA